VADIFISYSRKDSEHATSLAERLRSSGANVWMDTASLAAAEEWSAEIVEAINGCSVFVVLLSTYSVESTNVTKEVSLASQKKKKIIPLVLERCELNSSLEYFLAGVHHVHLADENTLIRSFAKFGINLMSSGGVLPGESNFQTSPRTMPSSIRIAVFPFEDQSSAHDNEWFSDGLTDELISTLNKLEALLVLDRNSTKIYRDAKLTTVQIAGELRARYVIAGAVRKAGEKIRVHATLIDGISGTIVWDEKFNGTMEDIFEIQEKTARDIAEGLKIKLTPEEELLLEEKLTNSPEAYQLYLHARRKGNFENDTAAAIELAQKALAIDEHYIPALSFLSISYANLYRRQRSKQQDIEHQHLLELQKDTIKKITAIDPASYYACGAKANYYLNIGEKELAIQMAKKGVALQPKKWASYSVLGFVSYWFDDYPTAVFAYEKAFDIDPSNFSNAQSLFFSLYTIDEQQRLVESWKRIKPLFQKALEIYPDNLPIKAEFMNCAALAGEHDIASEQASFFIVEKDIHPYFYYTASGVLCRVGRKDESIALLRRAIDAGWILFAKLDIEWFKPLEGTPEYSFLLEHIFTGY
jgi:TolB-like protein